VGLEPRSKFAYRDQRLTKFQRVAKTSVIPFGKKIVLSWLVG